MDSSLARSKAEAALCERQRNHLGANDGLQLGNLNELGEHISVSLLHLSKLYVWRRKAYLR